MAAETLTYQGINRSITDYAGSRACEELINLRPTTDGLVPVKPFTEMFAGAGYDRVFVHRTTDGSRYIGVRRDENSYKVVVEVAGNTPVLLFEKGVTGDSIHEKRYKMQLYVENLSFASAGNVLLFSERTDAENGQIQFFENRSFTWRDGGYSETEAVVPPVSFTVGDGASGAVEEWTTRDYIDYTTSQSKMEELIGESFSAVQENHPDVCFGYILVAIAFKTADGSTFWTNQWKAYDPAAAYGMTDPYVSPSLNPELANDYAEFFEAHLYHGYRLLNDGGIGRLLIFAGMRNVKVKFDVLAAGSWDEDTSYIRSVEVYASRPETFLDLSTAHDGYKIPSGMNAQLIVAQRMPWEADLDRQLMYHQASIPMKSLATAAQEVTLTFGGVHQVTEETLRVDAGAVTRYGRLLSYNARFHYFDSVARTEVGMPSVLCEGGDATTRYRFYVVFDDGKAREEVYVGYQDLDSLPYLVLSPSAKIVDVLVGYQVSGSTYRFYHYPMRPSSTYNYSIHAGPYEKTEDRTVSSFPAPGTHVMSEEPAAINVTEQYNPFVFRVEHSYLAPGNIIDVQPQMGFTADLSNGEYPLNVFTENGVYALYQGAGQVLYGAFKPMSGLAMYRGSGSVPVEMGTFFLAAGALWLAAGRNVTLVSDALSRGPHKYIRSCPGYKKISGQDSSYSPTPVVSSPVYDVSAYLSAREFSVFAGGDEGSGVGPGRLSYNRFRQEVYVSNVAYNYSYVLSVKYRQWYKVPFQIWQDEQCSDIASLHRYTAVSGSVEYADLSKESDTHVMVHLQTRPFSMGYQYSHVHRTLSMLRAKLVSGSSDTAVLALYGSDDLQEWNLLAYAKRDGTATGLKLSQMRTPSAARSWRYYTICFGGTIPADSDIGPFIVDYEPVVRRIG